MRNDKVLWTILGVLAITTVLVGCNTVRRVDYGEVSESALADAEPVARIPEWVRGNIMADMSLNQEEFAYFVGISQEQATSENEAVQEAYLDALRRVADALTVQVSGRDSSASSASTDTEANWPHLIRRARHATKDWDRDAEGDWSGRSENALLRDAVMALATIADTWVTREVGSQKSPILNMMKYEEVWKAKVLIQIPREELIRRMERIYELASDSVDFENRIRAAEVTLAFECKKRDADLEFAQREKSAELDNELRWLEYEIQKDNAKLDWAIRKAEAEDRLTPSTVPQPTFHFMNNSYWYGYGPGASTKAGVPRTVIKVEK